jgi:hypothetical protein
MEAFKIRLDRYCPVCGANKPIENHETWCPQSAPSEFQAWIDEEADVNDAKDAYPAPERPVEDWGLRNACLAPPTSLGAYFLHPDGIYQDGMKISSTYTEPAIGIGGAPTRATTLPKSASDRKQYPVASGVLDYFPDALVAISYLSNRGNEQHNAGMPLHWDRSKSDDEADTMIRHFLQRGSLDTDGVRHSVKMAWRSLALLQKEIEQEGR